MSSVRVHMYLYAATPSFAKYARTVTNVSFGENVTGNGRSCLKIQFNDIAGPGDEEDDVAKLDIMEGKPETKASKKGKGKTSEAEIEEDEDDDEDSSEDSQINFIMRETVLAALTPGKVCPLNTLTYPNTLSKSYHFRLRMYNSMSCFPAMKCMN